MVKAFLESDPPTLKSIRRWSGIPMGTLSEVALQAHCSGDDIIAITDQCVHVFLSTASTMPEANHDISIIRDIMKEESVSFLTLREVTI